jgi:catalase
MDGFGVHAYSMSNAAGRFSWVRFHWRSEQGYANLVTDADAARVLGGGAGNSHATQDLHDAIERKQYPAWKLFVQVMDPAKAPSLWFDPLDSTKVWPEKDFPLVPVGRLVLNKNLQNFFAENDMIAFNPSAVVPGISFSPGVCLCAAPLCCRHRIFCCVWCVCCCACLCGGRGVVVARTCVCVCVCGAQAPPPPQHTHPF